MTRENFRTRFTDSSQFLPSTTSSTSFQIQPAVESNPNYYVQAGIDNNTEWVNAAILDAALPSTGLTFSIEWGNTVRVRRTVPFIEVRG